MGRGTGKLARSVLKRTEELRGHPPVDMEGALSASAHSEVVAPRTGRGGTTSSNPLCSSGESPANRAAAGNSGGCGPSREPEAAGSC
jgi:hypothetical protein